MESLPRRADASQIGRRCYILLAVKGRFHLLLRSHLLGRNKVRRMHFVILRSLRKTVAKLIDDDNNQCNVSNTLRRYRL
jgi:hypothetical protein